MRPARPLLAVPLLALALAACGSADGGDITDSEPVTTAPAGAGGSTAAPATGGTSVTVSYWVGGKAAGGEPVTYELTCDGTPAVTFTSASTFTVDAGAACAALASGAEAFAPPPQNMACTMIYGGPQEMAVTGTVAGAPVDATLSRTDGCQIARWDALAPLAGDAPVGVGLEPVTTGPDAPVSSPDTTGGAASGGASGSQLASFVDADVTVTYWAAGQQADGQPVSFTLTCTAADAGAATDPSPVVGLPVDAGVACAALSAHPEALMPPPADMACTEIYGGPEQLRVQGTVDGRQVDALLGRTNGCEIARWDALAGLVGGAAPGAAPGTLPVDPAAESLAAA